MPRENREQSGQLGNKEERINEIANNTSEAIISILNSFGRFVENNSELSRIIEYVISSLQQHNKDLKQVQEVQGTDELNKPKSNKHETITFDNSHERIAEYERMLDIIFNSCTKYFNTVILINRNNRNIVSVVTSDDDMKNTGTLLETIQPFEIEEGILSQGEILKPIHLETSDEACEAVVNVSEEFALGFNDSRRSREGIKQFLKEQHEDDSEIDNNTLEEELKNIVYKLSKLMYEIIYEKGDEISLITHEK